MLHILHQIRKRSAERLGEAQCLIHALVAGRAADGQTGNAVCPAPVLRCLRKLSGNALPAEYRLNVKILKYRDLAAGKG